MGCSDAEEDESARDGVCTPQGSEFVSPKQSMLERSFSASRGLVSAQSITSSSAVEQFGSTWGPESLSGSMRFSVDSPSGELSRLGTATGSFSRACTGSIKFKEADFASSAQAQLLAFRHGRSSAPILSERETARIAYAQEGLPAKRQFYRESVRRSAGNKSSNRQHQKGSSAPPPASKRGQRNGLRRDVTEAASAAAAAVTGIRQHKPPLAAGPAGLWDSQSRFHVVRDLLDGYAADPLTGTGVPDEGMVRPGSSGGFLEKYVAQQAEIERLLTQQLQGCPAEAGVNLSRR